MNVLCVNCGGATLKYKLFEMPQEKVLASGHVDRLGSGGDGVLKHSALGRDDVREEKPVEDHRTAIEWMLHQLTSSVLSSLDEIDVVSHKLAHDGMKLGEAKVLGEKEIETMRAMIPLAPVHNPPSLVGIEIFQQLLPNTIQTGSFETGFHRTVAPDRFTYGLPLEWREKYGVRSYGFHSCSHRFVSARVAELMNKPDAKTIQCHLGSGTSVCAVNAGQSIGISSGLTPQCGTMMSTRPGDYDAGAVTFMMRQENLSADEYDRIEIKESGLKGISGVASGDMRDIEDAINEGNERAQLAFDVFVRKVRDYIGAYFVALNGLDAITFTAGIGENSELVRAAVCRDLDCLGAKLDETKNAKGEPERAIHTEDSKVQIWVIPTDEEIIVARDAMRLLK